MTFHRFRIVRESPSVTEVYLDEVKLRGVVSVEIRKSIDCVDTITLTIYAGGIEVTECDGTVDV